jgi:hypothetical protein
MLCPLSCCDQPEIQAVGERARRGPCAAWFPVVDDDDTVVAVAKRDREALVSRILLLEELRRELT